MNSPFQLAQINLARALDAIDSPVMAGFVARLDEINALAEASPGFVWRLKTDEGNATALRPYDDDRILVNMSVWTSPEHLSQFVYRSMHATVMRQRREWFARFHDTYQALWWIPHGHLPTLEEAKERLEHLRLHGPSVSAFSFQHLFPAPEGNAATADIA